MKTHKNKILLAAVCVCLLAVTAFGTLAYFTAKDSAGNTFMVADASGDKDALFSITVTESDPDKEKYPDDEIMLDKDGNKTGNKYNNITPGDTRTKDPTVTNTGKYDQWVRVQVTLSNAKNWIDALKAHKKIATYEDFDLSMIANGIDAVKPDETDEGTWIPGGVEMENDILTWIYYLKGPLASEESKELFKSVTIPAYLTADEMASLSTFDLTVSAQAIQHANTGDTPQDAFVLYDRQVTP